MIEITIDTMDSGSMTQNITTDLTREPPSWDLATMVPEGATQARKVGKQPTTRRSCDTYEPQ